MLQMGGRAERQGRSRQEVVRAKDDVCAVPDVQHF